jgi:hypothetical protein
VRRLAVMVVLAAALIGAAPAAADVYDDHPAAASRGPGDMVVLARGDNGAIYERHLAGGAWTHWRSIGGQTTSGPTAAAYGDAIHAFVVGMDFAVYENVLRHGSWSGWTSLGGVASSAPSAIARRGTNLLDLTVKGSDNAIHHRVFQPGAGWSPWASIAGGLTSAPALNSQQSGVLNVFARGTDGQLWQRSWTGAAWTEWMPLGGGIIGAPSVVSRRENQLDLFVRGTDRSLFQRWWTVEGGWSGFLHLDGAVIDSTPTPVSDVEGHLVLFARSRGGIVYKRWRAATGWAPWVNWGRVAPPPPPPPPPPPRPDGNVELTTGLRCTPPGGRLRVSLKIRRRAGRPKPRVRRVVFFVKRGPRRVDRRRPYVRRLKLNRPAGSKGRVFARAFFKRKGTKKLRRKTVSKRFVMCS